MADETLLYPCYALQVRSRYESTVAELLRQKGYVSIVPTYTRRRRWSDRYVTLEAPMIPGYVFCRFDIRNKLPVLCTYSVQRIIGVGKRPVAVDEVELGHLLTVGRSGLSVTPCPFQVGEAVCLDAGPLRGVRGTLIEVRKQHRLVVSISLLQRSVAVEVSREWVRPLRRTLTA